jgi:hypothetical protein
MNNDLRYLNIVAGLHLVVGVMAGLFSCLPLINLSMGLPMLSHLPKVLVQDTYSPFVILSIAFAVFPIIIVIVGWMFAIAVVLNGYYITRRQWLTYCTVMSGIETIFMPFGTVLGVFTIILLSKPDLRNLFDQD